LKYKYTGTSSTSVEMSSPCNDEIDMVITSVDRRIRYCGHGDGLFIDKFRPSQSVCFLFQHKSRSVRWYYTISAR
jgi:hypothetical protein